MKSHQRKRGRGLRVCATSLAAKVTRKVTVDAGRGRTASSSGLVELIDGDDPTLPGLPTPGWEDSPFFVFSWEGVQRKQLCKQLLGYACPFLVITIVNDVSRERPKRTTGPLLTR